MDNSKELYVKASMLEQQSQEFENQLEFVKNQVSELEDFSSTLKSLINSNEKEILSPLGKGVFIKSILEDKKLFVEVGSGIVVRKTPEETLKIINEQIQKFRELRTVLASQSESVHIQLSNLLRQMEKKN